MSDEAVTLTKHGAIGVITVNNPPVNALSPPVRFGLSELAEKAIADPEIEAVVLIGAGRSFIAGADIKGFGKNWARPARRSQEVYESSPKPFVAAIHGYALGGGLENALGCHYRIAKRSAKVGLPEVLIGILPGGGGTQRLPRLIGPKAALEMIVTGRHVPAPEAKELGIIDEIVEDDQDLLQAALAFARKIAADRPLRRTGLLTEKLDEAKRDPGMFDAMRKSIARKARNQLAPYHCIRCVEIACETPIEVGIEREQDLMKELENRDEAKGLRYAFFAEREANKLPDVPKDTPIAKIETAAVVGAGTMGGGIAMSFADFGFPVRITDKDPATLEKGMQRIRRNYEISVERGSLAKDEMEARFARITPVKTLTEIGDADVVVEAVFEEMGVKQAVFAELDAVMKPGALMLSNTSTLDIDRIASATKRPEAVAGAHFFSPANVMKLLEVVKGKQSSKQTIATAMKLGRDIGKVSVACGNCDGFLANRSRAPFQTEMVILLEEGALPEQVDKVMVDFGYPMGPFAVGDLAGLDIGYAVRKRRLAENPNGFRKLPIPDALAEMGRLGQKTSAGWFRYEKGDRTPRPDPEVAALIKRIAGEMGVEQRSFTDDEILKRLLFASVNEACKIVEEGIAYRASDVDIMWLYGFGFPRYRGGLMFWADGIGVKAVHEQISAWHRQYGDRWKPAALLERLAAAGTPLREATGAS